MTRFSRFFVFIGIILYIFYIRNIKPKEKNFLYTLSCVSFARFEFTTCKKIFLTRIRVFLFRHFAQKWFLIETLIFIHIWITINLDVNNLWMQKNQNFIRYLLIFWLTNLKYEHNVNFLETFRILKRYLIFVHISIN